MVGWLLNEKRSDILRYCVNDNDIGWCKHKVNVAEHVNMLNKI